ncbi:MAG: GNAT family N-acetyltransferase [Anaerolineaceae bacterium]|nr:GNAT family N-acetyltransferase [Anaerolineaceae bacterium]
MAADMIRPAHAGDAVAIGRLWQQLVSHHQAIDAAMPRATPDGPMRYGRNLSDRLADSHTRVFVAEEEGRVVGYVLGVVVDLMPDMFEQQAGGFLADIFVEASFRRQGHGRALVGALTDWFRQQGLGHYEWHVPTSNSDAVAFWRAMGGTPWQLRMRAELGAWDS